MPGPLLKIALSDIQSLLFVLGSHAFGLTRTVARILGNRLKRSIGDDCAVAPWSGHEETMRRKVLLACGILSSLLYVGANVVGARRWSGYSLSSQTVSELSAIGAPSRPVVIALLTGHGALLIPFGFGVREAAGRKRGLRATGALLMVLGASDLPAPLFPMHQREALARGEGSRTDTMHIIVTSVNSLLILLAIGFGSTAFGRRFRVYSVGTILVLLVTGGLTASQASRLEANLPTPWAGVSERISIGGYLLWQAVLATMLFGAEAERQ